MERKIFDEKTEMDPAILTLMIGGTIGIFIGGMIGVNITANVFVKAGICIVSLGLTSIMTLIITYFVTSAIMEVQSAIKEKKSSN